MSSWFTHPCLGLISPFLLLWAEGSLQDNSIWSSWVLLHSSSFLCSRSLSWEAAKDEHHQGCFISFTVTLWMTVNLGVLGVLILLGLSLNLPLVTTPTRNPLCPWFLPQPISFAASSAVIQGSHFTLRSLPGHLSCCLVVWPHLYPEPLDVSGQEAGLREPDDDSDSWFCPGKVLHSDDSVQAIPRVSQDGVLCHRLISPNTERFQAPDWNGQLPTMEAASVPFTAAITGHAAQNSLRGRPFCSSGRECYLPPAVGCQPLPGWPQLERTSLSKFM